MYTRTMINNPCAENQTVGATLAFNSQMVILIKNLITNEYSNSSETS